MNMAVVTAMTANSSASVSNYSVTGESAPRSRMRAGLLWPYYKRDAEQAPGDKKNAAEAARAAHRHSADPLALRVGRRNNHDLGVTGLALFALDAFGAHHSR